MAGIVINDRGVKPTVHIENWSIHAGLGGSIMTGNVQDHPRFAKGAFVYTSRIVTSDLKAKVVETRNTMYILGKRAKKATGKKLAHADA